MASKAFLLLILNIVFFTLVTSTPCPPPPSSPSHHGGGHSGGYPGSYLPKPTTPVPSGSGKCPLDALQLGVCADVLNGLVHAVLGDHLRNSRECCSLIRGLVDVDAALCLCTTIKADLLGLIHLKVPVALTVLLNFCHKAGVPSNFQCPDY